MKLIKWTLRLVAIALHHVTRVFLKATLDNNTCYTCMVEDEGSGLVVCNLKGCPNGEHLEDRPRWMSIMFIEGWD